MKYIQRLPKIFLLCILLTLTIKSVSAQTFPFWGNLKPGPYAVGLRDTVVVDPKSPYKYQDYEGLKPFFISIWYPAEADKNKSYLKFQTYTEHRSPAKYKTITDSLHYRYLKIYMDDGIAKDNRTKKSITIGESQRAILSEILKTKVNAKSNLKPAKGNFTCIVYHHGAQSTSFDNTVMCEFLASHGYVVVSTNYLWPSENNKYLGDNETIADLNFITSILLTLVLNKPREIIGAGHSWGAQSLLKFDTLTQKPFSKIISFHTTLEDKSLEQGEDMWSDLMRVFRTQSKLMTTPVFLIAPDIKTGKGYDFITFKENKDTPFTFITLKSSTITHDGFITLGNLRAPFAEKYNLEDKNELKVQFENYQNILRLTKHLVESGYYSVSTTDFESDFTFQRWNTK